MSLESIDIELETQRIVRAFRVVGKCALVEEIQGSVRLKRPMSSFAVGWFGLTTPQTRRWRNARYEVPTEDGLFVSVYYSFSLSNTIKIFLLGDRNRDTNSYIKIDTYGVKLHILSLTNPCILQLRKDCSTWIY